MKVMFRISVAALFATLTVACAEKDFDQASAPVNQTSAASADLPDSFSPAPPATNANPVVNPVTNPGTTPTAGTPAPAKLSGIELFITELYDNLFQRKPDIQGYVYWIAEYRRGETGCKNLTLNFLLSGENAPLRTRANQSARYRSEYIQLAYLAILNRGADQPGFEYYLNAMNNGLSSEQLELILLDSAEFRARCASYGLRY